jgi:hypothetical protein
MFTPIKDWTPNVRAAALTIVAGLVLTALGGMYTLGYNLDAKDLEAVRDFRDKLQTLMSNLEKLSGDLANSAELVESNKKFSKEVKDASDENENLKQALKAQTNDSEKKKLRIADLESQLAKIFPQDGISANIEPNDSQWVIPSTLIIGVNSVDNDIVEATVNGSRRIFHVGDYAQEELYDLNRSCMIFLRKIKPTPNFDISCVARR